MKTVPKVRRAILNTQPDIEDVQKAAESLATACQRCSSLLQVAPHEDTTDLAVDEYVQAYRNMVTMILAAEPDDHILISNVLKRCGEIMRQQVEGRTSDQRS